VQRSLAAGAPEVILKNAEPVRLTLKNAVVQVESAHLTGPATNVTLAGNVSLKDAKNPARSSLERNH